MHEGAIAESLLALACRSLPAAGRLRTVTVAAGSLAGIEEESLRTWFTELARGTAAEGAALVVRRPPCLLVCAGCGAQTAHDGAGPLPGACPSCGGSPVLRGGRELYLDSLEVEDAED